MSRPPTAAERACFGDGVRAESPADLAALREVVRSAEAEGSTAVAAGCGAHPEAGDAAARPPRLVTSAGFDRIEQYEPDDFTIGVGAGMRLRELRAELSRHRQELAHDFPRDSPGTIGSLIARAPYSPRTATAGPLHALVLGVEGVCGGGRRFRAGGMVVKNVAGYQVHKICTGSAGALGILTRINLRLRPLPETRIVITGAFPSAERAAEFAREVRSRRLEPAFLVMPFDGATAPAAAGTRLLWGFEGAAARAAWQEAEAARIADAAGASLETRRDEEAAPALEALAAIEEPSADRADGIVRLSLLPSDTASAAAELAAWGGAPLSGVADLASGSVVARWRLGTASLDAALQTTADVAVRRGGVAKLVHLPGSLRGRFRRDLSGDANEAWVARIRDAFDPRGVFARAVEAAPAGAAR